MSSGDIDGSAIDIRDQIWEKNPNNATVVPQRKIKIRSRIILTCRTMINKKFGSEKEQELTGDKMEAKLPYGRRNEISNVS